MNLNFNIFWPELVLLITACIVLFGEWIIKTDDKNAKNNKIGMITVLGLTISLGVLFGYLKADFVVPSSLFNSFENTFGNAFVLDKLAVYYKIIILISTILATLLSIKYVSDKFTSVGEFYSLICLATIGGMVMSSSSEMITFYLGIELISIASYVMCAMNKNDRKSSESAFKYFVIGGVSSALILYGFSIIFGLTGSTDFIEIAGKLDKISFTVNSDSRNLNVIMMIGIVFSLAGLAYKISVAPFHMWAPDVYEGAPIPVTAFLSMTSKIAGFAALTRFLYIFTNDINAKLVTFFVVISVITMFLGNVLSLVQSNIKRLLAYSSIAHAGYLLIGIIPLLQNNDNVLDHSSVLFYLFAYIFMNVGCFAAIIYFSKYTKSTEISSFSGMVHKSPFMVFVFSCCLISLAGLPPFGGFTGKFYLFKAAVDSGFMWLALFGALNSVISLYYYAKVIKVMYFGETKLNFDFDKPHTSLQIAAVSSLLGMLILFLAPTPFLELAKSSIIGF